MDIDQQEILLEFIDETRNCYFSKPLDLNQMSRQLAKLGLLKNTLKA